MLNYCGALDKEVLFLQKPGPACEKEWVNSMQNKALN